MDHGKVTWMRLLQYKNDLAVHTNAH